MYIFLLYAHNITSKNINMVRNDNMTYKRTDLALEQTELYKESTPEKADIDGVEIDEETKNDIKITRVKVLDENGERLISKPVGSYITLEAQTLNYMTKESYEDICLALKNELEALVRIDLSKPVLVVGLGNRNITADSLGPKTVEQLFVTRHLFEQMPELVGEETTSVCAIAPGVLGITGIETMEIVKGVVNKVSPGLVIAVDALAARKLERINTTLQISDTGINPGSGVGNNRKAINRNTLGVDVISIGVPTVVDAITMSNDTLDMTLDAIRASGKEDDGILSLIEKMSSEEKYSLIQRVLAPTIGDMVLTVKEVDMSMNKISKIIAGAINKFLQKNMTFDEIESFAL